LAAINVSHRYYSFDIAVSTFAGKYYMTLYSTKFPLMYPARFIT
jgi:hypothetical protein